MDSKTLMTNEDVSWLATEPAVQAGAVQYGYITMERLELALAAFQDFLEGVKNEWPPEKVKAYFFKRREGMVEDKRKQYIRISKMIKQLELDNRDERSKGMSYKERQAIVRKMKTAQKYLENMKDQATRIKKAELPSYKPELLISKFDMFLIQDIGFEEYLNRSYPDWVFDGVCG